jgi:hypothetical protein
VLHHSDELGVRVVVVAFAPLESLVHYQARQRLGSLLVLSDPGRRAYRAFDLGRASILQVWLDPRVWARYLQLVLRGRRPKRAHEDTLQLAGDALIDSDGRVAWIYRSRGPEDRPSIAEIRSALRDLRASREAEHA